MNKSNPLCKKITVTFPFLQDGSRIKMTYVTQTGQKHPAATFTGSGIPMFRLDKMFLSSGNS